MTKQEECKKELIHKIITNFKNGKLKSSSGNMVKSKQQVLAIRLTMSQTNCYKYLSKEDKDKLKKKVDKFLQ